MTNYGLATYELNNDRKSALVIGDSFYDLATAYKALNNTDNELPQWVHCNTAAITQWQEHKDAIEAFLETAVNQQQSLQSLPNEIKVLAPFNPTTIFGTASNYHEHAEEMETELAAKVDSSPYVFMKAVTSVVGTNDFVVLPPETKNLDWEVELAVVIGKPARRVKAEQAIDYIAGFTVVNDISARDLNRRNDYPFKHDWFRGKSWDTFCPLGPAFVPKSAIEDLHNVKLSLFLNGKQMQDGNTSELIWDVFEQIEYISSMLTLRPGDVIMTGTPAGVGKGIGLFLKDGDELVASAEGIGSIKNTVQAEQV
ncbi:fumarylacetoacetate hydrolase family protein [Thalassotalea crassostreae]|uniref:fumarylacetoacetate hydrolase family protein n=1 Tax=Thalassotalea crassostreae TaxID=1763536 RepID=UPI000839243D|nr:fumarylacetoacetate hydrolase family protein [Thalassotalea crassostreae]